MESHVFSSAEYTSERAGRTSSAGRAKGVDALDEESRLAIDVSDQLALCRRPRQQHSPLARGYRRTAASQWQRNATVNQSAIREITHRLYVLLSPGERAPDRTQHRNDETGPRTRLPSRSPAALLCLKRTGAGVSAETAWSVQVRAQRSSADARYRDRAQLSETK